MPGRNLPLRSPGATAISAEGSLPCPGAVDLLLALNVAESLQDLSPLMSVGLHKLKGVRAGGNGP